MSSGNVYIDALARLTKTVPIETIASETGLSLASLKQVLAGTPLPSGRNRGLGPGSRDAIGAKYPHWLDAPVASRGSPPTIEEAFDVFAAALGRVEKDKRRVLLDATGLFAGDPKSEGASRKFVLEALTGPRGRDDRDEKGPGAQSGEFTGTHG